MKEVLRNIVRAYRCRRIVGEKLPLRLLSSANKVNTSVLIPAAAPGGLGDDAMMNGAVNSINIVRPNDGVAAMVPRDFPNGYTFNDQLSYERVFTTWGGAVKEAESLFSYSHAYFLGADIMDGAYSYPDAVKRIKMARACYSQGVDSRIVGFSLNDNPHPAVIKAFKERGDVPLFLRDPLSYERAKKILGGNIQLSADVAFLLQPIETDYVKSIHSFVRGWKDKGKAVFGLNIHDLLGRFSSEKTLDELIHTFAKFIDDNSEFAFVLIPHDYRSFVDDRKPLEKIVNLLQGNSKERIFMANVEVSASEIKGMCNVLDGVITGRMHLAIAALGVGVPVLGIVYQGKFEGTLSFFNLEKRFLMTPSQAADYSYFQKTVHAWAAGLTSLRREVSCSLERILELSKDNFK
ncbi:MAG: polysaccharide pyruvyl transferase family protein [Colwellia sp.]